MAAAFWPAHDPPDGRLPLSAIHLCWIRRWSHPARGPWGEASAGFSATFQISAKAWSTPTRVFLRRVVRWTRLLIRVMQATLDGVAEGRLHMPGSIRDGGANQAPAGRPALAVGGDRVVSLPARANTDAFG
jgi:hypothetical protein